MKKEKKIYKNFQNIPKPVKSFAVNTTWDLKTGTCQKVTSQSDRKSWIDTIMGIWQATEFFSLSYISNIYQFFINLARMESLTEPWCIWPLPNIIDHGVSDIQGKMVVVFQRFPVRITLMPSAGLWDPSRYEAPSKLPVKLSKAQRLMKIKWICCVLVSELKLVLWTEGLIKISF